MGATPPHGTVNQFAAGGRFPSGQSSTPYDCTVAAGKMALDAWSGGALDPSTTTLRGLQRDQVGGIDLGDLGVAFKALGVGSSWKHGPRTWSAVRGRLEAGGGVVVQGTYLALGKYRASNFTRGHAIYLERIVGDQVLVHDPLRNKPVWIPVGVVQRFLYSPPLGAGWFTGTYAGAPASTVTGTATSASDVQTTLAALLGIPADTAVTPGLARQAAERLCDGAGTSRSYCLTRYGPEFDVWLKTHPGILAGGFPIRTNAAGGPPAGSLGDVADALGIDFGWVPGVLVNGAVLIGVIALAYSGLNDVLRSDRAS